MKQPKLYLLLLAMSILNSLYAQPTWRSALYPTNWEPGFTDNAGRFLQDFSYAGYAMGEREIPNITSPIIDITKSPYNADNTATTDVTAIIQQAINDLPATGGVVYLPAGEYKMSVPSGQTYGVVIDKNNVVIRGAGKGVTKLKNVTTYMRSKKLFYFGANNADWKDNLTSESALLESVSLPTQGIKVENPDLYVKGDWIVLRNDLTDAFITEHKSTGYWVDGKVRAIYFCRQIKAIDANTKTLYIDIPTRYPLKKRDNARVYKLAPQLMECGIEDLSIGNIQHPGSGLEENDYSKQGTAGYDVHDSHLILFKNAVNCWARRLSSYKPSENPDNIHILSNTLDLVQSRGITVEDCDFRNCQYKGAGGNGYMYILASNECLIKNCHAENGRHHYSHKLMSSNGNVIYNCSSKNPTLFTDFHMHLSMSNLIDNLSLDNDIIDAGYRTAGLEGAKHMYTTTQSVMWNIKCINKMGDRTYVINSRQYGNGYNIGTSGESPGVNTRWVIGEAGGISFDTSPEDFTEGLGQGATLRPISLYVDQLDKRRNRPSIIPQLPTLNIDFEDYFLNERFNSSGNRFVNYGVSISSEVVENPNKSGINTSNQVLKIERASNNNISAAAVTNRGVFTDSYDLTMTPTSCIVEMKVLKTTDGKLAARLNTDFNSEVATTQMTGSPNWQTVQFNFENKLSWTENEKVRLQIQVEKNSSPESLQKDALTVYVDDIKLITSDDTSIINALLQKGIKINYLTFEKKIIIESKDLLENTNVYLTDLTGKIVLSKQIINTKDEIKVSNLASGIYILSCKTGNNILLTHKIIL